jgi:Calx-beta domain/IPT/TIG domain
MRAVRIAVVAFLFTAAAYAGTGTFYWWNSYLNVNENIGTVTMTVYRYNGSSGTVTVDYATSNGSALAGTAYTAKSGTLTFADGEVTKDISIPIIDNNTWDGGTSYFNLTLSNATGGASISNALAYVYIYDNEPQPVVSIADVNVPEGNSGTSNANFTATISGARSVNAVVNWYTSSNTATPGVDYVSNSGTLTFTPADTQKTFSVGINGDAVYEPDETFYVFLYGNVSFSKGYAFCTIVNDDPKPVVSVSDVSVAEGNSGRKAVTVTLTANQPIFGYLYYNTVDGTAVAGRDYDSISSLVYWNGQTQQQLTFQVIGDTDVEPDELFKVHFAPDTFGSNFTVSKSDITITIVNDDIGVGPPTQNVPKGGSAAVILDVGNAPPSPQPIAVSVSDPCISAPSSATLTGRSVSIPVSALTAPCSANVQVTVPAALGGKTYSAGIRTFSPLTITFDPATPQLYVGQTVNVHVTFAPFDGPVSLPLGSVGDNVQVPASVNVDATGGTFAIKGLKTGTMVVVATLPPQNGNGTVQLFGNVLAAPTTVTILGIAPASGPTTGGTNVNLTGANFSANCTYTFGGTPATNVAYQSATAMTANTPAHVAGAVDVTASCGTDTFTLHNAFTFLAGSAAISGVSPSFGSTLGGTLVRITGHDFAPACWAFFDGVAARNVTVNGATEVLASVPAHAAGAVAVSLRCGTTGNASLGGAFNYSTIDEPAPVITSVTPLAAAPGQTVTIDGSRFRVNDGITFGSAAAQVLATAPDAHVVVVPALPLGKVSVNVSDASGHLSTTGPIFTVLEPATPQVTKVTPSSVPAGGELTIEGTGFRDPYTFALGDTPLRLKQRTPTKGVAGLPATLARGTYELHVLNASGAVAAIGPNVTVTDSGAVIANVTPVCATTDGGTVVSIAGSGFASGATVTINGVAATNVTVVDAAHINATLPALGPGPATVAVGSATATNALRIYSPFDPDGCGTAPRPRPARR